MNNTHQKKKRLTDAGSGSGSGGALSPGRCFERLGTSLGPFRVQAPATHQRPYMLFITPPPPWQVMMMMTLHELLLCVSVLVQSDSRPVSGVIVLILHPCRRLSTVDFNNDTRPDVVNVIHSARLLWTSRSSGVAERIDSASHDVFTVSLIGLFCFPKPIYWPPSLASTPLRTLVFH